MIDPVKILDDWPMVADDVRTLPEEDLCKIMAWMGRRLGQRKLTPYQLLNLNGFLGQVSDLNFYPPVACFIFTVWLIKSQPDDPSKSIADVLRLCAGQTLSVHVLERVTQKTKIIVNALRQTEVGRVTSKRLMTMMKASNQFLNEKSDD